jgi:hypothetical protein
MAAIEAVREAPIDDFYECVPDRKEIAQGQRVRFALALLYRDDGDLFIRKSLIQ